MDVGGGTKTERKKAEKRRRERKRECEREVMKEREKERRGTRCGKRDLKKQRANVKLVSEGHGCGWGRWGDAAANKALFL